MLGVLIRLFTESKLSTSGQLACQRCGHTIPGLHAEAGKLFEKWQLMKGVLHARIGELERQNSHRGTAQDTAALRLKGVVAVLRQANARLQRERDELAQSVARLTRDLSTLKLSSKV